MSLFYRQLWQDSIEVFSYLCVAACPLSFRAHVDCIISLQVLESTVPQITLFKGLGIPTFSTAECDLRLLPFTGFFILVG